MRIIANPLPVTDLTVLPYYRGQFLIQQRSVRNPKNGKLPRDAGYCCFPGEGLKEIDGVRETMDQAVRRWGQQEYGVDVPLNAVHHLMQYEHRTTSQVDTGKLDIDNVVLWIVGDRQNFILKEGAAFHWMSWYEIPFLPLGFELRELLPYLEDKLRRKFRLYFAPAA